MCIFYTRYECKYIIFELRHAYGRRHCVAYKLADPAIPGARTLSQPLPCIWTWSRRHKTWVSRSRRFRWPLTGEPHVPSSWPCRSKRLSTSGFWEWVRQVAAFCCKIRAFWFVRFRVWEMITTRVAQFTAVSLGDINREHWTLPIVWEVFDVQDVSEVGSVPVAIIQTCPYFKISRPILT
jgi:hypothetical protein